MSKKTSSKHAPKKPALPQKRKKVYPHKVTLTNVPAPEPILKPAEKKVIVKFDWAFRRLVNQAAIFMGAGDPTLKREWADKFRDCATWSQVQGVFHAHSGGETKFGEFMNKFFGHEINKAI